jgi:NAD(P)-dependent dehydrogenase (short-subunit alcohol dehydrogenase family)
MKSKNIVIVGGGSSIGKAITDNINLSEHNVIIITSKDTFSLKKTNFSVIHSTLKDEKEIKIISKKILKIFDNIDILFFNNGGGLGIYDDFISFKLLKKLLWYNLGIIQEFINELIDNFNNNSRIICVGSVATKQITASIGYTISKSSLENYVRLLSKVLIPKNIHIICLSMGAFLVDNNAMDRLKKNKPDIYQKYINEKLPRKKMGNIFEIIPIIKFLFFKDVGMFSGSIIPMDGGENIAL